MRSGDNFHKKPGLLFWKLPTPLLHASRPEHFHCTTPYCTSKRPSDNIESLEKWRHRVDDSACVIGLENCKQLSCRKIWWTNLQMWVCVTMPVTLGFGLMKLSRREFDLRESGGNYNKRQWCWTQMIAGYLVSWGQWKINLQLGHHLSCTSRLEGVLCQQKHSVWRERFSGSSTSFLWFFL